MGLIIAIIDDYAALRKAVRSLVQAQGWEALTYESGEAFLASCLDVRIPDCIVLDSHMGALSGADVVEQLPRPLGGVPVIIFTSDPNDRLARPA